MFASGVVEAPAMPRLQSACDGNIGRVRVTAHKRASVLLNWLGAYMSWNLRKYPQYTAVSGGTSERQYHIQQISLWMTSHILPLALAILGTFLQI